MTTQPTPSDWTRLYRAAGVAALIAGLLFRRNLGVEIGLFAAQKQPADPAGWFALLQNSRLLGLAYLSIFDVLNYLLLALVILALYLLLRPLSRPRAAAAALFGWLGIAVYLAGNTAFSMLALSTQYAAATDAQRPALEAAGQALLALNRFSAGAQPGSGGYLSLLLVALATLLFSTLMLRGTVFPRAAAVVGILAGALDLAYCLAYPLLPTGAAATLAVTFIPAAGLLIMLWHILIGVRLLRGGRE